MDTRTGDRRPLNSSEVSRSKIFPARRSLDLIRNSFVFDYSGLFDFFKYFCFFQKITLTDEGFDGDTLILFRKYPIG